MVISSAVLRPRADISSRIGRRECVAAGRAACPNRVTDGCRSTLKVRRHAVLNAALGAIAIGVWGCNPYLCVYETRFIATEPSPMIGEAAGSFAGYVNFRDYSEREPVPASIVWHVEVQGTAAVPTRLVLSDARDTTRVFANFPIQQTEGRISASAAEIVSRQDRDRVFEVLASGNGVLILSQEGRSRPLLIPLRVTDSEDWHRPNCS